MYFTVHTRAHTFIYIHLYFSPHFYSTRPFQAPYPSLCLLPGYACFTITTFSQPHSSAKLCKRHMQTAEVRQKFIINRTLSNGLNEWMKITCSGTASRPASHYFVTFLPPSPPGSEEFHTADWRTQAIMLVFTILCHDNSKDPQHLCKRQRTKSWTPKLHIKSISTLGGVQCKEAACHVLAVPHHSAETK